MKTSVFDRRVIRTAITAGILLILYLLLITIAPRMSIWATTRTVNGGDGVVLTQLRSGDVFDQEFEMPYRKICSIKIPLDQEDAKWVLSLDASMYLIDPGGSIVVSKKVTSVYDNQLKFAYKDVAAGEKYHLRLVVDNAPLPDESGNAANVFSDGNNGLSFDISGVSGTYNTEYVFAIVFFVISSLVIAFVWNIDKTKTGDAAVIDRIMVIAVLLIASLVICQFIDLFDISNTSFTMLDSLRSGDITKYADNAYFKGLSTQDASQYFICDYDSTIIFIAAVFLLPSYLLHNGDLTYNNGGYAVVFNLIAMILICVILTWWMIKGITDECGMNDRYLKNVRTLFITSSALIYMTVGFGQIDILYIVVVVLALPFYYRKKYELFSLLMSLAIAMKTLPIMIFIPLILLANKKILDIVKNLVIALSVPVIGMLLFERNTGMAFIKAGNEETYGYVGGMVGTATIGSLSLFVLAFGLICIFCYMHDPDTGNKKEMLVKSMIVIFITYVSFISFVEWHQQWLIPLVLSFSFLIPFYVENKKLLLLSCVTEVLFILTTNSQGVSTYMINYGIIPPLVRQNYSGTSMKILLSNISPIAIPAVRTLFAALLVYTAWYFVKHRTKTYEIHECSRTQVIGRMGVICCFIMFYCWCFSYI